MLSFTGWEIRKPVVLITISSHPVTAGNQPWDKAKANDGNLDSGLNLEGAVGQSTLKFNLLLIVYSSFDLSFLLFLAGSILTSVGMLHAYLKPCYVKKYK